MRKTLLDAAPPSASSPGRSVSASTHAGASCVFELRDMVWRRSSQALDGTGCAITSAGEGRTSVKASCADTRHTAAKKIANAARSNIEWARLVTANLLCKLSVLMRSDLQTVRHFKHRRQNTEHNQTDQNGDHDDDYRRNQLRDHAHAAVQFALVHIGDRLHGFGKMSGLFAHGHHVREQVRKELLLLQRSRERRAIDYRLAYLAKLRLEKAVTGDLSHQIE